jgi:hypothetical protein
MLLHHAQLILFRLLRFISDILHLQVLYDAAFRIFMGVVELDVVPDFVIRRGIRFLLGVRLQTVRIPTLYLSF